MYRSHSNARPNDLFYRNTANPVVMGPDLKQRERDARAFLDRQREKGFDVLLEVSGGGATLTFPSQKDHIRFAEQGMARELVGLLAGYKIYVRPPEVFAALKRNTNLTHHL